MATVVKKTLSDLRITDINAELEKRKLDKIGTKAVLAERLKKALLEEGQDPNTFQFDIMLDGDELLGNDYALNGKSGVANTAQGRVRSVPQVGDGDAEQGTTYAAGGHGHGVGEEDEDDFHLEGNRNSTSSTAKSGTGFPKTTTPAKGKKNQSSAVHEGGDESFVLQEDDTVLNDIDADLLDGEGKAAGHVREAGDNKGDANKSGQAADASKLLENTDTKDGSKTTGGKDEKDTKTAAKSSSKTGKDDNTSQLSRNLWVSGLSSSTRATDLKALFGKHGKVMAAKVVTSARSPAHRCFGLVTLSSVDDATKCLQQLHRTELRGRMISVEYAKTETQGTKAKVLPPSGLKSPTKHSSRPSHRTEGTASAAKKDDETQGTQSKDKTAPTDKDKKDVVSFSKIKADQELERLRRKEMFLEREKFKQRMIEKRQRDESFKIERERRRLREMREELERQHIETERLRLETERLHMEREQEKYRREQQRVLQERRPIKRRGPRDEEWPGKRPMSDRFHGGERFEERQANNRRPEERRTFREERPQREGRPVRDERHPRDSVRGPPRHESRAEWKSERDINRVAGAGSWNGPAERAKLEEEEWDTGNMEQGDGWENEVLSQQSSNFAMQQGQMMAGLGGTGYLAQQGMQGPSVMMQGNMARQGDGRFGIAAASVRRF